VLMVDQDEHAAVAGILDDLVGRGDGVGKVGTCGHGEAAFAEGCGQRDSAGRAQRPEAGCAEGLCVQASMASAPAKASCWQAPRMSPVWPPIILCAASASRAGSRAAASTGASAAGPSVRTAST